MHFNFIRCDTPSLKLSCILINFRGDNWIVVANVGQCSKTRLNSISSLRFKRANLTTRSRTTLTIKRWQFNLLGLNYLRLARHPTIFAPKPKPVTQNYAPNLVTAGRVTFAPRARGDTPLGCTLTVIALNYEELICKHKIFTVCPVCSRYAESTLHLAFPPPLNHKHDWQWWDFRFFRLLSRRISRANELRFKRLTCTASCCCCLTRD